MTPEDLYKNLLNIKNSENYCMKDLLKNALKYCFVDKFALGYERPCENDDFLESKILLEKNVSFIYLIIEDLIQTDNVCNEEINRLKDIKLLATILIICGENECLKPWNTEKTVKNCKLILHKFLKLFDSCDGPHLMKKFNGNKVIKEIMQIIRPKLLSDTWKCYPATVISYHWILKMIVQPEVANHLSSILPTALLLTDDFVNQNKILGIKSLHHIINNLTLAELQFHGHGDVIYNALMPLVRIREAELIDEVIPCLVTVTSKLEVDLRMKNLRKWSKFDNIFEIYLENMELETLIDLRDCYIKNLIVLLNACGHKIMRWSKRLFRILKEYLEIAGRNSDDKTTNYCLKVIEKYVDVTKEARNIYIKNLSFLLLMALHNSSTKKTNVQKENQEIAIRIIKTTGAFSESDKEELRKAFKNNLLKNSNFQNIVTELLNSD